MNVKRRVGPLEGVRVLALTRATAGPFCAMWLADLGAEIITIEAPGEVRENISPESHKGMDAHILSLNRNKKAMDLDLKKKEGKEVFFALVEKSDVVLDNFRGGVLDRLGAGYETLKKINPRIISCSITSYGLTGPYRERPGFDSNVQCRSGRASMTWEKGHHPARSPGLADLCGAMAAAYGITSALYARERTGLGQRVDISSLDVQISLLANYGQAYLLSGHLTEREPEQDPSSAGFGTVRTKDGYIAIAARRQRFWEDLCKALGRRDLVDNPKFANPNKQAEHGKEVWAILNEIFRTRTNKEWEDLLVARGIPCDPVNTMDKALADPQVLHRNMVVTVEDRDGDKVKLLGNPIKMSSITEEVFEYPPEKGQDTDEVLTRVLGYSRKKISQLREEAVI